MRGQLLALLVAGAGAGLPIGSGPDSWNVTVSEGVTARVSGVTPAPPRAVRLEFDFRGRGGWAGLRTPLPADLPENWELSFLLKGDGPPNTLEVRLLDPSGENVWSWRRKAARFPSDWDRLVVKKRQLTFAGGPAGGGEPKQAGALELAVTPGEGGRGALLVADVLLDGRPVVPETAGPPGLEASSSAPGHPAAAAMDGNPGTFWESGASGEQKIAIDFGAPRAFGGLAVTWEEGLSARAFVVEASDDGASWRVLRRAGETAPETSWLRLPGTEARHLRLRLLDGDGPAYGIREIALLPFEVSESPSALFAALARAARRGLFPRAFRGEQVYWTVAGVDGGRDGALLSEDGAVEPGTGSFSVEPFVKVAGRLVTWADVVSEASLAEGSLPIPTVTWTTPEIGLKITAFADGSPDAPRLLAHYRLRNRTRGKLVATLALAIRPLLVNPPTQGADAPSGVAAIRALVWDGRTLLVNGSRAVVPLRTPASVNATSFAAGDIASFLEAGRVPPETGVEDASGLASGTFAFPMALEAGGETSVVLEIPLLPERPAAAGVASPDGGSALFERRLEGAAALWREKLGQVALAVPAEAEPLVRLVRANLGFALAERSGPALRPGSRASARSRIRDGALIGAALLRLGHFEEVRDFLLWYAPYQFESGRIPCAVDGHGADPHPENDSNGEFLYLAGEYFRFTGDRATIGTLWPRLARTVAALDALRRQRRTEASPAPARRRFDGLATEPIGHEGPSSRPARSYGDDLWALRGLKDAVFLAEALGKPDEARTWAPMKDGLRAELFASLSRTMEEGGVGFVPGSADPSVLDPTSMAILLDPVDEASLVPAAALSRTWERYIGEFRAQRDGKSPWQAYTPHELRNVGALIRLGRREEGHELLSFFREGLRPPGWSQWAGVVGREVRAPRVVGDMPHAGVGTDFIRSFLDFFAYTSEADSALVLGAGIPEAWLSSGAPVGVQRLRTPFGALSFSMSGVEGGVLMEIAGGLRVPPGGLILRPPGGPFRSATVDGKEVPVSGRGLAVRGVPATVVFRR